MDEEDDWRLKDDPTQSRADNARNNVYDEWYQGVHNSGYLRSLPPDEMFEAMKALLADAYALAKEVDRLRKERP